MAGVASSPARRRFGGISDKMREVEQPWVRAWENGWKRVEEKCRKGGKAAQEKVQEMREGRQLKKKL